MPANIDFIKKQLQLVSRKVKLSLKDTALSQLSDAIVHLHSGDFKAAYHSAQQLYTLSGVPKEQAVTLFHTLLFAEDVVTSDSVVFIHKESPYFESLKNLAQELGFTVQEHQFNGSYWTKDYMVSSGKNLIVPVKESKENYVSSEFIEDAKKNNALYYGALNMSEHHQSKANLSSAKEWSKPSRALIQEATYLHKTILEGGNFFCAVNKKGERFYLVGENVISETMAYNKITRKEAVALVIDELICPEKNLLIIPQWTYHLDLQMAYLGKGQFIIHSFKQKDIDFGLSKSEIEKVVETFAFLEKQFEQNIIEATVKILESNGFMVQKVFGCLFYLEDNEDVLQQKYVPYCKGSEDYDGALALMMNGITLDLGEKGRHFVVARCDLSSFKQQYAASLEKLGITSIRDADMLKAYDDYGNFDGMLVGVMGVSSVTAFAAYMNGALRCQTSIISKGLSNTHSPELSAYNFFKKAAYLDLEQSEKPGDDLEGPKL